MSALRLPVLLFVTAAAFCGCGDGSPGAGAVKRNMDALSLPDVESRIAAATELGRMRASNAVPRLIAASEDVRPDVRMAAVEALVEIGDPRAQEALVRHLKSGEWRTRQLAAQGLGRLGQASAAPHLREAMRDGHVAVAASAATALASCGGPEALVLVALSGDEPAGAREAALLALGESGAAAIQAIRPLLGDTNDAIRAAAYNALAKAGGTNEAALMIEGLVDPVDGVRKSSEKALLAMEPETVLPVLVAALDGGVAARRMAILRIAENDRTIRGNGILSAALVNESQVVRQRAGQVLAGRKQQIARARQDPRILPAGPLIKALASTNEAVRTAAVRHIEEDAVADASIGTALRGATRDQSAAVRAAAVRFLVRHAPGDSIGTLEPLLKDADATVRLSAAMHLVRFTNETAAAILVDDLERHVAAMADDSSSKDTKEGKEGKNGGEQPGRMVDLVGALGSSGSSKAVPVLLKALALNKDDLLPAVIRALGTIGDRSAYDKVLPLLARGQWSEQPIRNAAIEALAVLDPARAAGALVPLLANSEKWQPESCVATLCRVLSRLKDPRAAEPMIDRMRERYENASGRMDEVKLAAAAGLVDLGGVAVPAIVRRLGDARVREGALAMVLGRIGEPALGPTVEAMKSPDALARKNAAWALGYMKAGPGAVAALCAALADGDTGVRAAAAWSLGNLRAKESVAELRSMLASTASRDRVAAAEALGRIGDAAAAPDLIARLQDTDPDVRFAAVTSLGALGDKSAIAPLRSLMVREAEKRDERLGFAAGEALNALGAGAEPSKPR